MNETSWRALLTLSLMLAGTCAADSPPTAMSRGGRATPDPFAYCERVGTDDRLGLATGDGFGFLMPHLRATLGISSDALITPAEIFWRCMDSRVYVCAVGANLPCASKADRARRNRGAERYCRDNPAATDVPAYAAGHQSLYAWRCRAGKSVRGAPLAAIDARGFRSDIWRAISK